MDIVFDTLKRKMSGQNKKGKQPQPRPRQIYNTRSVKRDRQLKAAEMVQREAMLGELQVETLGNGAAESFQGGARPKTVSMDPKILFQPSPGLLPVQDGFEGPVSLPAKSVESYTRLRREDSAPLLTRRKDYAADKEVMFRRQQEREAIQNQNVVNNEETVTIEDVIEPPEGLATNKNQPQGDVPASTDGAWALSTGLTTSQPPVVTASNNEQTRREPAYGSEEQYFDYLQQQQQQQQQGYNFVIDQHNMEQRLMQVSGHVEQLTRMFLNSSQEQEDARSRMAALKKHLDFMDSTHSRMLDEILNTVRTSNEGAAAQENMLLSRVRRLAGLDNGTLNKGDQNRENDVLPPPSVERSRAPHREHIGGYNTNEGDRNHSQRPGRNSSTGRGEPQTPYHTVQEETGQREQREPYGIAGEHTNGGYGAENVTRGATTGGRTTASVSFQPGMGSTPINNPGAGARNKSLGAPNSSSESYGAKQRSYQHPNSERTQNGGINGGLFMGQAGGSDPGDGGSSSEESSDGDRRSDGPGGPGDGRDRSAGGNGGQRGNGGRDQSDRNGGQNGNGGGSYDGSRNGGHRGSGGRGGRGNPPPDPPGGNGGQGGSGGWKDDHPFFNGLSWNQLPAYFNERFGPIHSGDYVGWALEIVQERHPEWDLELCQAMVRPVPENLRYDANRDPLIENLREFKATSDYIKAVINKNDRTKTAKVTQYNKDTIIFEDYFSEIAELGRSRFLEDQDLKEIIFRTMPTQFQQDLRRKNMEPNGKYAHFLRADRYAFTIMITLFPLNSKLAAQEEFEKCRQTQTQNLEEFLDLKQKFYRMGYSNYGEENREKFYKSTVQGLRNTTIKKKMITYLALNLSKLQQKDSFKEFKNKLLEEASVLSLMHSLGSIGDEGCIGASSATTENMRKYMELMHQEQRKDGQKRNVNALDRELELQGAVQEVTEGADLDDFDTEIDNMTVNVVEGKTGACFNCGEEGHFRRECTKPLKKVEPLKEYWRNKSYAPQGARSQYGSVNSRPGAVSVMNAANRKVFQNRANAGSKTSSSFRSYSGAKKVEDLDTKFATRRGFVAKKFTVKIGGRKMQLLQLDNEGDCVVLGDENKNERGYYIAISVDPENTFDLRKGSSVKKFTAKIGGKKVKMLQLDDEGNCVALDDDDPERSVQEDTEETQGAVNDSTTAVEDTGEDKGVVHSMVNVEPEEDSWVF